MVRILPKLNQIGYSVKLFVLLPKYELLNEINLKEIKIYKPLIRFNLKFKIFNKLINSINILFSFVFLFFFSLKNKNTILHFILPTSYLIGGLAGYFAGHKKMIMSRRSLNNYQKRGLKIFNYIEFFLHKKMNFITGNSKSVVKQLKLLENVSLSKLHLIYNGIEHPSKLNFKIPKLSEKVKFKKSDVVFVKVANLINYKGHLDLINACKNIKSKNWKLLIVGKGVDDTYKQVKDLITLYNLNTKIFVLGSQENVFDILNLSHVGILTSHEEGFSNSLLEYMASGLPIIATNVGGNNEIVKNNYNGILVEPKQPNQIKVAIEFFINNTNLRKKYGQNSKMLLFYQ